MVSSPRKRGPSTHRPSNRRTPPGYVHASTVRCLLGPRFRGDDSAGLCRGQREHEAPFLHCDRLSSATTCRDGPMRIRVGYEITYDCPQATPFVLMLRVNPSRGHDLEQPDVMVTRPALSYREYVDGFG